MYKTKKQLAKAKWHSTLESLDPNCEHQHRVNNLVSKWKFCLMCQEVIYEVET